MIDYDRPLPKPRKAPVRPKFFQVVAEPIAPPAEPVPAPWGGVCNGQSFRVAIIDRSLVLQTGDRTERIDLTDLIERWVKRV